MSSDPIIEVCHGPECSDCGGRELYKELQELGLNPIIGDCRNQCPHAPMSLINNRMISHTTILKVENRINDLKNTEV
ncbi:MAG: (2Fe-2S) ferredoxin domain-containing protein [Mariprofundaceae bacterium]